MSRSECPARYFVAECMTTSTPRSSERTPSGVLKVASTATSAPCSCAAAAIAGTSGTAINGLVTVSSHTRSAPSTARTTASVSATSTRRTVARPSRSCSAKIDTAPE